MVNGRVEHWIRFKRPTTTSSHPSASKSSTDQAIFLRNFQFIQISLPHFIPVPPLNVLYDLKLLKENVRLVFSPSSILLTSSSSGSSPLDHITASH
ncbi:hypothetical protein MJO28_015905 [Puccinia striiformis f. sp. tritici]|uniref:Uncharacterized protein n=1 Tax=Puccinia striiformis f. sp. tritici TaxID=168172 RepID=A0ACC0DQB6_9BASI|nr:hypothetical protein Pst134EA_029056 [Puccinia striiformis f. sp. tritici]KAI9617195.1 hypothetical protein H4Q26_013060 [Puccinia striiformis f. sp. tritici PST-130]KAH9441115.1 hypothetical protein Pst134EB_029763 [Puccinia striiformis f. sp. tritici]KAH9447071.1 hypothetical protein Pst134EA_029056 [Puccinia striiformis f. sp. tritici]KAI7936185.1 hypothetical protein MJO29_015488 [Puccinia striiformis f. sp. tritici]KAI7937006.1 hypothetical protein MJO28_015905 [Puccinia striiformis f.